VARRGVGGVAGQVQPGRDPERVRDERPAVDVALLALVRLGGPCGRTARYRHAGDERSQSLGREQRAMLAYWRTGRHRTTVRVAGRRYESRDGASPRSSAT